LSWLKINLKQLFCTV